MLRVKLTPLALAFVLAGCATGPSQSARDLKDADPATVNRDCKLLGTVTGKSLVSGAIGDAAESAVADARERAARMGATHILFLKVDTSGMLGTGQATARAYKC
jgi:hypothetical protein